MSNSHFVDKLEKWAAKATVGIEQAIKDLKPIRTLALFVKPQDRLFKPEERLPPQAFYNQQMHQDLVAALNNQAHEEVACAAARIDQDVVKKLWALGKKGLEPYRTFYLDCQAAMARSEIDALIGMKNTDPVAYGQFVLKQGRASKRWNKPIQTNITVTPSTPVVKDLSDAEKLAKIAEIKNRVISARVVDQSEDDNV